MRERVIFIGRAPQSGLWLSPVLTPVCVCCGEAGSRGMCEAFVNTNRQPQGHTHTQSTCSLWFHLHRRRDNARALQSQAHSPKKENYKLQTQTSIPFSIQMGSPWVLCRLFIPPHSLNRIFIYIYIYDYAYISFFSYTFNAHPKYSFSLWNNFLLSLILICFFLAHPIIPPPPLSPRKTYLIAPCFIFNPWYCPVTHCFCFIDIMAIASTILMMWWDWPNARQSSGTDEKTRLTDFLFYRSLMNVCAFLSVAVLLLEIHNRRFWSQGLQANVYIHHRGAAIKKKKNSVFLLVHPVTFLPYRTFESCTVCQYVTPSFFKTITKRFR